MTFSQKQVQEIIKEYTETEASCPKLGKKYNVHPYTITRLLRKNGIEIKPKSVVCRRYTLNDKYFEKIDIEEKAYILGLLYTDGFNCSDGYSIRIELSEQDKEILYTIAKLLETNIPIKFNELSRKNKNWQNAYRLDLCSKKISSDLYNLGCVYQKSLTLTFPNANQVPKRLLRHFLRGCWDGDGCFGLYSVKNRKSKQLSATFVSTLDFCTQLKVLLLETLDINCCIKLLKNQKTAILQIGGNQQIFRLEHWLYNKSKIHITRKYHKYLEHKQWIETRKSIPQK